MKVQYFSAKLKKLKTVEVFKEGLPPSRGNIIQNSPTHENGISKNIVLRHQWFPAFLILACLIVYWPVLSHQFQYMWDDQWQVINRYTEMPLTWHNLWTIFTEFYGGQYSPINQLIYTLLYTGFGYNPFWFHTLNLAVHTLNALLVYFLLNKLLGQTRYFTISSACRIAFFTALLFSVHPLQAEAVAWISASKIVLYTLFYLLALYAYVCYAVSYKVKYYLLTVLCFVLSFGAKEQAVMLPVCLLLIDYAIGRSFQIKRVLLEKLPLFALSLIFGYVTMLSQASSGGGVLSDVESYPFHQNLLFACYSFFEYIVKCLVPLKLSYLYIFPNQIGESVPLRFWIYPPIIAFLAISLSSFWKRRWVLFGLLFFIIHIGIVLHIIPISRFVIVADRYVYVASVGLFFIISYLLDLAIHRRVSSLKLLIGVGVVYFIMLGTYANIRSRVWHDSETLKKELIELIEQQPDSQKQNQHTH